MNSHVALAIALIAVGTVTHAQDEGPVAYQPDILGVERLFLVALRVPTGAPEIAITVPQQVTLLDRTPLPTDRQIRKYYFRTLQPTPQADIIFQHPDGPITISVEIWSFEDLRQFRELKGVQLPRRWPLGQELPELKQSQTLTSEAYTQHLQEQGPPSPHWLEVSDEQIWAVQPDSTIPRCHRLNLGHGCPIHGTEIYKFNAYYPWIKNAARPWKVECPIGGELYPSNDFAGDDFTSGDFPDDGIGGGYISQDGIHYGFIGELAQAQAHRALRIAPACADGYLATGDLRYVHKALVAITRIAAEYAYLATMTQHRHRNKQSQVERLGQAPFSEGPCLYRSGFTIYGIEQPIYQGRLAQAYDAIWPAIDQVPEIIPFLRSKGFAINTHEDVRRFIEENLFAVWIQGGFDGSTRSNEPRPAMGMARIAECLNYERGTDIMKWLYYGGEYNRCPMRSFVTNSYYRDGAPYEATGHYNGVHLSCLAPLMDSIEHIRSMRPQLYPEHDYPSPTQRRRYKHIFDFSMDTVTLDRSYPKVGDDTYHGGGGYRLSYPHYVVPARRTWQNGGAEAFEHAYNVLQDPKYAWALANAPAWEPSLGFPYTREQIEAAAAEWPDDWNDASSLHDGYGLAILRSGSAENKRALWMMYGRGRGHVHDDIMDLGLGAYGSEILGCFGYPRGGWEKSWGTHNLARQFSPYVQMSATAQLFADAGPVQIAEILAQGFENRSSDAGGYAVLEDNWQRRMLALVDVSEDQFYCLDLYRIHGGEQHWWSFHCQEGDFTTQGLELVKQPAGTLAGPQVPYADKTWIGDHAQADTSVPKARYEPMWIFPHLYNVERATPSGLWSADWELKNSNGLHFRMTIPQANTDQVIITDGKRDGGASPFEMKIVLMHNQDEAAPAKTQIANVMEMYRDAPVIKSVRHLELSGDDEAGFDAYGLVVELNNGRVDTVFAAADPTAVRTTAGGFEFAGRFGLYSEQDGEPVQVVLVGGTRLTKNGRGVLTDAGEYRATITAVDCNTDTITVSPPFDNPQTLIGQHIHISNSVRRVSYKVLEAENTQAGTSLRLSLDSLVGTGQVTGHSEHKVETATPFNLSGYRYYHGARMVNAERTANYRIIDVRGGALIDAQAHPECPAEKLHAEFPIGSWFDVYDYGVGDEVFWPLVVNVTEVGPVAHKAMTTARLTLGPSDDNPSRSAGL